MTAAHIRIDSIRPASGRVLVRVALQSFDLCPNPRQTLQALPLDCAYEDQVSPGGGSA